MPKLKLLRDYRSNWVNDHFYRAGAVIELEDPQQAWALVDWQVAEPAAADALISEPEPEETRPFAMQAPEPERPPAPPPEPPGPGWFAATASSIDQAREEGRAREAHRDALLEMVPVAIARLDTVIALLQANLKGSADEHQN